MEIDYGYLCENLGHLSGLQVRVYQRGVLIHSYVNRPFAPDIAGPVMERIWSSDYNVSYYDILNLVFVGAIKVSKDDAVIVVGPTSLLQLDDGQLTSILRLLGEPGKRLNELADYFQSIPGYPLENFLQILCFVNYALNDEKLTVRDLIGQQTSYIQPNPKATKSAMPAPNGPSMHNTLEMEKALYSLITAGRPDELQALFGKPPTGRPGKVAHTEMRQRKNVFVISAALASRAAIAGGMLQDAAFTMSDLYIQKAELLGDLQQLTLLNMEMLLEYARKVEVINHHGSRTKLVSDIAQFIIENINQKLSTADIAGHFQMNRTHLCERFKNDVGITLNEFVNEQKIVEAKRLLTTTDQNILHISEYLGYSSQGYFQNVFKKMVGCTPKSFREKNIH